MTEHVISKLLGDFERGAITRRQLIQNLATSAIGTIAARLPVTAAEESKGLRAVAVDHISYQVADYAKTRDFYAALLGLKVVADNGEQCLLVLNGSSTYIVARNAPSGVTPPRIDHIAYSIEHWDTSVVQGELKRRGLNPQPTRHGSFDANPSFYVTDPNGFDVQISGKGKAP